MALNRIPMNIDLKFKKFNNYVAQQNDNMLLDIDIMENGVAKDLSKETLIVNYVNANNTIAVIAGNKVVVNGNNVKISCPTDCSRSNGQAKFSLTIKGADGQTSTYPININIEKGVIDGQAQSGNIATIVEELNNASLEAAQKVEDLENVISTADTTTYATKGEYKEVKSSLEETKTDINNIPQKYIEMAQSSKPSKKGVSTSSYKIIFKDNDTSLKVIQATNKQYLLYNLQKGIGGQGSSDTGGNKDLLRITQVSKVSDVILWWWDNPTSGEITTITEPNAIIGTIDERVAYVANVDNTRIFTNSTTNLGLGLYDIGVSKSATWTIKSRNQSKLTILFSVNSSSSNQTEIIINNKSRGIYDLNSYSDGTSAVKLLSLDFDIPYEKTTKDLTVTLKNNATSGNLRIIGFNVMKLKDYKGEVVNSFKVFPTSSDFIKGVGANDYAFYNTSTSKWIGSYHGGETVESCYCTYMQDTMGMEDYYSLKKNAFHGIVTGKFWLVKEFEVKQTTNISDGTLGARIISNFDFSIDGTVEMNFSLNDNTIPMSTFYTALTCTRPSFEYISYPKNEFIMDKLAYSKYNIKGVVDGVISQYDKINDLELTSRFTQFGQGYMKNPNQLWCTESYNKHYYGIIKDWSQGIVIPDLTWSKGLDFIVY